MSATFSGWLFTNPDFEPAIKSAVAAAAPQMPPYPEARSRIRTGRMAASWNAEARGMDLRVGSDGIAYTIYNEMGTRKMSAQPMLAPSIPTMTILLANEIASNIGKL